MISVPEKLTKVLLIDDDEDDYLITKRIIKRIPESRFSLDWCPSFEEAKDLIAKRSHDIYQVDYLLCPVQPKAATPGLRGKRIMDAGEFFK